MSGSDFPTTRPAKPKPSLVERVKAAAQFVGAITAAAGTALTVVKYAMGLVVTREELEKHNSSKTSHIEVQRRLESLEESRVELYAKVNAANSAMVYLGERLVSLTAADREPDKNKKSDAADFYRTEYHYYVKKGYSVENAFLEALRTPYRAHRTH